MTILIAAPTARELGAAREAGLASACLPDGACCLLLRTGIGMRRAARRLAHALARTNPSVILVTGYAGALDPSLQAGDIVIARRVSTVARGGAPVFWDLAACEELERAARAAELRFHVGDIMTWPRPVGRAAAKARLFRAFRAAAVDMESAALARIAAARGIPLGCVRAVSDRACENLALGLLLPRAGVAAARRSLARFFAAYCRATFRQATSSGR